jgi:hypothetical protein
MIFNNGTPYTIGGFHRGVIILSLLTSMKPGLYVII